jgi:hypothetical protein
MWYRRPAPEEELTAIALLREQVNLFTHPSHSFTEETAEDKKINEENLLTLLPNAGEGVVRVLLPYLEGYMRSRAAMESKGAYVDPLEPEYSAEATTERMLKYLDEWTAEVIERQLYQDQQGGSGNAA